MRRFFLLIFALVVAAQMSWSVDKAYYSSLEGKKDSQLRQALTVLLYTNHTKFAKYDWDFPYDYDASGNMLDIYSDCGFNNHNTYPSSYKCCCDAVNREHVVCQSNFGGSDSKDKIPQYSDRHHLYPVDGRANGHRSDLPFGECSGGKHGSCSNASTIIPSEGTSTCANHEFGKSGSSTFSVALPSGGGSVYEVGDEYKGDIARAILYMVVRYAESTYCRLPDGARYCTKNGGGPVADTLTKTNPYPVTAWANTTKDKVGQMFSSSLSTNYGLSNYGKTLLLKWHRQDPVSAKEIARNTGVEGVQGNRNPFVDYPCLVEYLWGNKVGEEFDTNAVVGSFEGSFTEGSDGCSCAATPEITYPTGTITFGATNTSTPVQQNVLVRGVNLESGNLSLSLNGANSGMFSLSTSTISKSDAESGKTILVTYAPTALGEHSATLNISGCGVTSHTVTLTGSCENRYTVTWKSNGAAYHTHTVAADARPDIPEVPDNCDENRIFVGWTTSSYYLDADEAPADMFTTTAPVVTKDATFYAVFATAAVTKSDNFGLFSGEIEEGDYIIYYNGKAMKDLISNKRFAYKEVTPVHDTITTTNDSIVWHIAPVDDEYWTIYNTKVSKYAASTGNKNEGQLMSANDTSKAVWTVSGEATYEFVNKYNSENDLNANLRNNGTYGFACYNVKTGGALSLYKQLTTIDYSDYSTYCNPDEAPVYTTTFLNTGKTHVVKEGHEGEAITDIANPTACDGYTFYGWSTHTYAADNTNTPDIDYTGVFAAAAETYNAVYSYSVTTPGTPTPVYVKVTSTSGIENGQYLIVYESGKVAFDGRLTDFDVVSNTIALTINNDTIASTTTTDSASFTFASKTEGYSIKSVSNYYIGHSGSGNSIKKSTEDDYIHTLNIDENGNFLDTCHAYVMKYNTTSGQTRFRYYDSSTMKLVQLYKRVMANIGSSTTTYYTTAPDCPETPTGIEEKEVKISAQKVLIGGQLFILRDGKLYDARGQRVK